MTTHFLGDTAVLLGRSLRHILLSPDTIITTAVMPIAMLLLFVYVFGGAINSGSDSYVTYLLPGILLITIATGVSYTAFRLFLDEPTTGLDPEGRIEVWQAVQQLAEGGTTVLLTTQYLDEAEHLADRIAILHEGRIIVNGTLAELKQLLPPATVEYVEKQPTLEDIFLAIVGDSGQGRSDGTDSNSGKGQ